MIAANQKNAHVLITGAAGGIGSAVVKALAPTAELLIVTDKNEDGLDKLTQQYENVMSHACDLASTEEVESLIRLCIEKNINCVVHSAGFGGPFVTLTKVSYEDWRRVFRVNVDSLYLIAHGLLSNMVEQKFGRIIALSSIQGSLGSRGSSAYVASKHALNGLIKTIAVEYGGSGITANAICPGYIRTQMGANDSQVDDYMCKVLNRTPTATVGEPSQVADVVAFLLSKTNSYMNGSFVTVDGGISADVGIL